MNIALTTYKGEPRVDSRLLAEQLALEHAGTIKLEQRLILTTLQAVYRRHLHDSLERGDDHREAGRKAKDAALAYMATAGGLLLGGRAA